MELDFAEKCGCGQSDAITDSASQSAGDRTRLQCCGLPVFELVGSNCPPDSCIEFVRVRSLITNKKEEAFASLFLLVQRSNPNPNHLSKWLSLHRLVLWCVCLP